MRADQSNPTFGEAIGEEARRLAGSPAGPGRRLAAGSRLGRYEIVGPLGAGGMGEVWRARDTRLGREVAIKVLPRELTADAEALQRFESEARAVAALSHPNILALHDFERDGEIVFAVTELLEGETLRQRLAQGPVPPRKAREWGAQVARALAAAHDRGIVHRDVKPENLFVTKTGTVKLLDFGVARRQALFGAEDTTLHTAAGVMVGTVGYMAPEQVRGAAVDFRADLFALGCVLYELLTGEQAFHAASMAETLSAILLHDPPRLDDLADSSPDLARLIRRCLEKRPEERFQNAHDLAFALEGGDAATRAPAAPSLPAAPLAAARPWGWLAARWRWMAAALAAVAAAALLLLLGRLWAPPPSAPKLRSLSYSGQDWGAAVSPDGRILAFVSRRDGQPRIWLRALATGEESALTTGPDEAPRFSPDGAGLLFARHDGGASSLYRVPVLGGEPRLVVRGATEGDWSPDGRRVCFVRQRRGRGWMLGVAGTDGSGEHVLATSVQVLPLVSPRWSPTGERIAVVVSGTLPGLPDELRLVRVAERRQERLPTPPGGAISAPAWLRGGRALLYAQTEQVSLFNPASRLVVQDTRGGRPRVLLSYPQLTRAVDLLASGRAVLDVVTRRAHLREVPVAGGDGRWLTQGDLIDRQPVYSPDGARVVFSSSRSGNLDLWAIDRATGTLHRLTDDPGTDWDPGFSADGRQLLWSSNRSGHFEVWIADADGHGARQLSHDGFAAENPTATPDGWVVYEGGRPNQSGLWKVRLDGRATARVLRRNLINHPEVSPDGRLVAFHTAAGGGVELRLVRVADGKAMGQPLRLRDSAIARSTVLAVNPTSIGRLRWLRDGRRLLVVTVDGEGRTGVSVVALRADQTLDGTLRPLAGFDSDLQPESLGLAPDGGALTLSVPDFSMALMAVEGLADVARPGDEAR